MLIASSGERPYTCATKELEFHIGVKTDAYYFRVHYPQVPVTDELFKSSRATIHIVEILPKSVSGIVVLPNQRYLWKHGASQPSNNMQLFPNLEIHGIMAWGAPGGPGTWAETQVTLMINRLLGVEQPPRKATQLLITSVFSLSLHS